MPYGITTTGFVPKTEEILREEVNTALRLAYGNSINLTNGFLARLRDVFIAQLAELWELGEGVYNAFDPDAATGTALEVLGMITKTLRLLATHSTVTLTLCGDVDISIPIASRVATLSTAVEFETTEAVDTPSTPTTAWVNTTAYVVGDYRANGGNIYVCITAGTSAGSGGPTTTAADITDGTVHWRYVGSGDTYVEVEAQAVDTGVITALSGDLTEIVTPISGWDTAINLLDATEGRDLETDGAFRLRRFDDVDAKSVAVPEAIKGKLLAVTDVTFAQVFYNDTDLTDADGVPPHSVEALVSGGVDADIAEALFNAVAAGIGTHGTETETVTDSEGVSHTIEFSRPTLKSVYVDVELTYRPDYPSTGDDLVKAAIVAWADTFYVTGRNVVSSAILARVFGVLGVDGVSVCDIGFASNPTTDTTLAIAARELATFDTSRITVVSTPYTP